MEAIFSKLAAHLAKGLCYHNQFTSIYGFLNFEGYQKWQEYRFLEESKNYRALQNFYLQYYNKILIEDDYEKPHLIPSSWTKYKKVEVDIGTKRSTLREMMKTWIDWEEETVQLLSKDYKELNDAEDFYGSFYIKEMLKETEKELEEARTEYISLETIGYDINVIVPEQKSLYDKYTRRMVND